MAEMNYRKAFERAAELFDNMHSQSLSEGKAFPRTHANITAMGTASVAANELYRLGKDTLLELEKRNVVHRSTISGGSLSSARHSISNYFLYGRTNISHDQYEQLCRTCRSALKIYESGLVKL